MSPEHLPKFEDLPPYFQIIQSWIEPKSEILDLGCGNGDLLAYLMKVRECRGEGVEISRELVSMCVNRGLPVHNGDIDDGLEDYPDGRFDVVILSQTLQEVAAPQKVLQEILRVGKLVIIAFPNFGYWRVRTQLFFFGRAPRTRHLPFSWYESPNRHVLTVLDFEDTCKTQNLDIVRRAYLARGHRVHFWPNFRAATALMALKKQTNPAP